VSGRLIVAFIVVALLAALASRLTILHREQGGAGGGLAGPGGVRDDRDGAAGVGRQCGGHGRCRAVGGGCGNRVPGGVRGGLRGAGGRVGAGLRACHFVAPFHVRRHSYSRTGRSRMRSRSRSRTSKGGEEFAGWRPWLSSGGRWWATRKSSKRPADPPEWWAMTVEADDARGLREAINQQEQHAARAGAA
jgi:hypothetical protein